MFLSYQSTYALEFVLQDDEGNDIFRTPDHLASNVGARAQVPPNPQYALKQGTGSIIGTSEFGWSTYQISLSILSYGYDGCRFI